MDAWQYNKNIDIININRLGTIFTVDSLYFDHSERGAKEKMISPYYLVTTLR